MSLEDGVLQHLAKLVAFNTSNPPRDFDEHGLFDYIKQSLPGFGFELWNHGDGCISLLAERGQPEILFNFHVDTVPSSPDWTQDPWTLKDHDDRVSGLGSCDIKGASAAMLTAANTSKGDLALLFTSDEENGNSLCVKTFLKSHNRYKKVIIAEPTNAKAISAHRGILSGMIAFKGAAGHASSQKGVGASALHQAVSWGHSALDWASNFDHQSFENLSGLRFNIGYMNGGIKPNMIAPDAEVRFGFRYLPGMDPEALFNEVTTLTTGFKFSQAETRFLAPAFTSNNPGFAKSMGLPPGEAVDYWTEAALFSADGMDALVFGPGDIQQAHTADEWVSRQQLFDVARHYQRMIDNGQT